MMYKGWLMWLDMTRVQWRARRHGLTICHPDKEGLMLMIDKRAK